MVLFVLLFFNQNRVFSQRTHLKNLQIEGEKRVSYAWSKNCIYVRVKILPVKLSVLQIGHLIHAVSKSCAPSLESTSSLILVFLASSYWLGLKQNSGPNFLSLVQQPVARRLWNFFEPFLSSWTRSFTVRISELGCLIISSDVFHLFTNRVTHVYWQNLF